MKKIITAAIVASLSLSFGVAASQDEFECVPLTLDNIKSIYEARESVLVGNPYIEGVCVPVTFSANDDGAFDAYYRALDGSGEFMSGIQGDFQRVVHAREKSGRILQKIIYVTDGVRAKKVSAGFGERNFGRIKREEIMFYHEVSHLVRDSLLKGGVDKRELETMADISALYIYSHVNGLTVEQFNREVFHLFRDRQRGVNGTGYGWYHKRIWLAFLDDGDRFVNVDTKSLLSIYNYAYGLRDVVDEQPKDIISMLSAMFGILKS